jgi:hypothetical protein
MPRRLVLSLIALGLTMALTATPVAALGTPDQQQTTENNFHFIYDGVQPAQVFTAGITGQLDHVDLFLNRGGDPGDDSTGRHLDASADQCAQRRGHAVRDRPLGSRGGL